MAHQLNLPVYDKLRGKRFILASTSPRRKVILNEMGFDVDVIPSNFPEDLDKAQYSPSDYVLHTAIGKGLAVWNDFKSRNETFDLLLSADTVVECQGEIFEKPQSKDHHRESLKRLRDYKAPQHVLTGVVLIKPDISAEKGYIMETMVECSTIIMDYENISDAFIDRYVESGEGWGVAAGYRAQGVGAIMMKSMEGDFMNCVGLPFRTTFRLIEKILDAHV